MKGSLEVEPIISYVYLLNKVYSGGEAYSVSELGNRTSTRVPGCGFTVEKRARKVLSRDRGAFLRGFEKLAPLQ